VADTLAELIAAGETGSFDFAFIDADKENYDLYYEQCLKLVRPGALIAVDNALWHGAVADPARDDVDTVAIRALNRKIRDDRRVDMVLLPIGTGCCWPVRALELPPSISWVGRSLAEKVAGTYLCCREKPRYGALDRCRHASRLRAGLAQG
jgi:hypothetical protein